MEKLIQYFIQDTDKKIDSLKEDIHKINDRLGDLQKFKVEMMVSSRWVSFLISSACGFVTLVATSLVTIWISRH